MDQRIAFVTCERLPDIHGDDRLVANALQSRGFHVRAAVWNDPAVDWRQFASVVIRAAWDYHLDEARYTAWLRRCETEQVNLWNPAATVLANIDKQYLADFADAGVPIVPIEYVTRGQRQSLRTLLERRNWTRAVVKPAVSASAQGTWRTSLATAAADQRQLDEEVMRRSLLVQPFVDEIVTSGEWSVVFFDGEYSHAVLKKPASGDFRVQEELGGHPSLMNAGEGCPPKRAARRWACPASERATDGKPCPDSVRATDRKSCGAPIEIRLPSQRLNDVPVTQPS